MRNITKDFFNCSRAALDDRNQDENHVEQVFPQPYMRAMSEMNAAAQGVHGAGASASLGAASSHSAEMAYHEQAHASEQTPPSGLSQSGAHATEVAAVAAMVAHTVEQARFQLAAAPPRDDVEDDVEDDGDDDEQHLQQGHAQPQQLGLEVSVRNICFKYSKSDIMDILSALGLARRYRALKVPRSTFSPNRGYFFLRFDDLHALDAAVALIDNREFGPRANGKLAQILNAAHAGVFGITIRTAL